MERFFRPIGRLASRAFVGGKTLYRRYRALRPRLQIGGAVLAVFLIGSIFYLLGSASTPTPQNSFKSVSVASVAELTGGGEGVNVFGTVRSRSEATIFAENGGQVVRVHASLGQSVAGGYILAELENASERAAVLSAEGSYEAAVAARNAVSITDVDANARNTYRSAYTDLDTALEVYIDTFYGSPGVYGPKFILSADTDRSVMLSKMRGELRDIMRAWQKKLANVENENPETILAEANASALKATALVSEIAKEANKTNSHATTAQFSALASARALIDGSRANITGAIAAYRSANVGATASVDAQVKSALGSLRAAEALLEKTLVRAPFAGTVNFLSIRPGDYVASGTHVATVAQNEALEITANISEENRLLLVVGKEIIVEGGYTATVTSLSPALNPETKQVEVRLSVDPSAKLVNGQAVRVTLPLSPTEAESVETPDGPVYLPLTSVKLEPDRRVVFTVSGESRLSAVPVEIGDVRGSAIEITTPLDAGLVIVTDARGLSEGERVNVVGLP